MRFPTPLVPATLIRRYKRFLADIRLEDGTEVTAHCANPGSMLGLADPGTKIWVEPNDDPKKKLKYGWRLVDQAGTFTVVDTAIANRVVKEALLAGRIEALRDYSTVLPEQKYGEKSRIDFLLRAEATPTLPDVYVEVKSVTLSRQPGLAEFPDSVTARGARHMEELAAMTQAGHRAMVLFLVQRSDADRVTVAADIDPAYAAAITAARASGVEVLALSSIISAQEITAGPALPFA
ncbi:DNA/RNA nuclease SfsA [Pseudooceanicola onchidii]|uniref:DNA/RNA nuclease SfsA n=1 Tax=Pseudooceanicola onchidii TaxID=2562279 RepID=UPI0010AA550C|nr:DNA/RNA nuclease SfsA [Pseudooceanicola onchidii]